MCTFEPKPNSYWAYALVLLLWGHVAPFSLPITALVVPFFIYLVRYYLVVFPPLALHFLCLACCVEKNRILSMSHLSLAGRFK